MLRGGRGVIWTGTHDLTFTHHKDTASLRRSQEQYCAICVVLARLSFQDHKAVLEDHPIAIRATIRKLQSRHHSLLEDDTAAESVHSGTIASKQDPQIALHHILRRLQVKLDALLEEKHTVERVFQHELQKLTNELQRHTKGQPKCSGFRLDFHIEQRYRRTFLLKPINHDINILRTPKSLDTCSDEVFERTYSWITRCDQKCMCFKETDPSRYPKRLLDLEELRKACGFDNLNDLQAPPEHTNLRNTRVRLVDGIKASGRYVTLSHCWGKPKSIQGQLRLTSKTEKRFREKGIELHELSKTFRDAVLFACRLEQVRYIWIDSLCIVQPAANPTDDSEEASKQDWLEQSRLMGDFYRHSYLNISATAAQDGDQGLFFPRRPEQLWENEINVLYTNTSSFGLDGATMGRDELTRCNLIDLSFWTELVDQAPVNRRGWVIQERLLAPRIVHFCHNQIAWECEGFQDVEGHPDRYTTLRVRDGDIVDEGRLKGLDERHGIHLRAFRLQGFPDPDKNLPNLGTYELWKRMVEVYSCTTLTMSCDKLIALSGIAQEFFGKIRCEYVAGMWREHLESQLLWQVNELYRDGAFENPARRDALRAPSFSWAAIDTPHGITYGEVTDYGKDRDKQLFFEVIDHEIKLDDPTNPFGLIKFGRLRVNPRFLHRIVLRRLEPPWHAPYGWRLREDLSVRTESSGKEDSSAKTIPPIEHYNICFDAPDSDVNIFAPGADLYCMPAAFGERTVKEDWRDLICLLLLKVSDVCHLPKVKGQFMRIGITKLSSAVHLKSQAILTDPERPFEGEILLH